MKRAVLFLVSLLRWMSATSLLTSLPRLALRPRASRRLIFVAAAAVPSDACLEDQVVLSSSRPPAPRVVNVVLTHTTADFDSLASAVGLAKIWKREETEDQGLGCGPNKMVDTVVVLPRGAHPSVCDYLSLHKHLLPIASLKPLLADLVSGKAELHKLGMVDCQRVDRIGPASVLLDYASHVVVVDHHDDQESDVAAHEVVVEHVGSVSTIVTEMFMAAEGKDEGKAAAAAAEKEEETTAAEAVAATAAGTTSTTSGKLAAARASSLPALPSPLSSSSSLGLTDAEATLLALGVHSDTGSLTYDSASARDGRALAWLMEKGASQVAATSGGEGGGDDGSSREAAAAAAAAAAVGHGVN
jgi:tRNA nucleotidyltransferase (CCA-adding enzyme)